MQYKVLGKTGLKVSHFSLGSWITFARMEKQSIDNCMSLAYERGINLFDTAEVYDAGESEIRLGESLSRMRLQRDTYAICSKVFWGGPKPTQMGLHRKHVIEGCDATLKRLNLDYLDFYLCHRADLNTSIEEIIIAMNILIQQGKILYWGTSEWPPELITEAYLTSKAMGLIPPSIEQFEYNLFKRDNAEKTMPKLRDKFHLGTMTTMPLATGILAGKYNDFSTTKGRSSISDKPYFKFVVESDQGQQNIQYAREITTVALDLGLTPAQLSLAWCLHNQHVDTVILGASRFEQLEENLESLTWFEANKNKAIIFKTLEEIVNNAPCIDFEPTYEQVLSGS